jgi:hypothetical protein
LKQKYAPDPARALELTAPALSLYQRDASKSNNIPYHELVRRRAEYHLAVDQRQAASAEINSLADHLASREVNRSVLDDIRSFGKTLASA